MSFETSGSGTQYSCPSCEKLKTQSLCFATSGGDGIITPLQFGKKEKIMKETDIKFLESHSKNTILNNLNLIRVPERTSEREFGYQKFNSGMTRHISVKDDKELHLLLMQNVPSDVYCSNAYYSFPNLPMNEKDWKEADLIFDIDAKDLNLSCRERSYNFNL